MPLRQETLRAEILAFLDAAKDIKDTKQQQEHFATQLALAVDRFVRSGEVTGVVTALNDARLSQVGVGRVT